jgi:plasmid maintenance system antidote protein VapI
MTKEEIKNKAEVRNKELLKTISEKINEIYKEIDINPEELAKDLCVDENTLKNIVEGNEHVTLLDLVTILSSIGLTLEIVDINKKSTFADLGFTPTTYEEKFERVKEETKEEEIVVDPELEKKVKEITKLLKNKSDKEISDIVKDIHKNYFRNENIEEIGKSRKEQIQWISVKELEADRKKNSESTKEENIVF